MPADDLDTAHLPRRSTGPRVTAEHQGTGSARVPGCLHGLLNVWSDRKLRARGFRQSGHLSDAGDLQGDGSRFTGSRQHFGWRTPTCVDHIACGNKETIGIVLISEVAQVIDLGLVPHGGKRIRSKQVVACRNQVR